MKTQIFKKTATLLVMILLVGCSNDDDAPVVDPGVTVIEKEGDWLCELGNTCENVYQFEFKKDSKISVTVEDITGSSVVSLDLSADFGQFGGPNLLNNGNLSYYGCTGQDEEVSIANISITETGTYNFSIARDWGLSAGSDGSYKLIITSNIPFTEGIEPVQNGEVMNYERECL